MEHTMVAQTKPTRKFVPADFNAADWSQIEPLMKQLTDRPIESPAALEAWLADMSELSSVIDEACVGTRET